MQFNEIEVINFLTMLFDQNLSYSAVNTARSALSMFMWDKTTGLTVGNLNSVKRLFKGIFELRPPKPRYSFIWDANIVIDFLKNFYPNEDIPLSHLSYKLVMLIALASAQRAQTLHMIYVSSITFVNDLVVIPILNLLKQYKPGRNRFSIQMKMNNDDPSICVVRTLKEYIERTKSLRNGIDQLFISFLAPHSAVSKSTISRWIKTVLEESGIDIKMFGAHSTRAASCSNAKRNDVPIGDILKTAGWSNKETFEKFYDKVIMSHE